MTPLEFSGLLIIWLLATLFIATLTWFEFAACALISMSSFHCCFC
jgi:hypothetical protein